MFALANQTYFSLRIENLRHDPQVLAFHGRETISQPFCFGLELVSERSDPDPDALLHQPAFPIPLPSGQGVHGQLTSIAQGDSDKHPTGYRATLEPHLVYLGLYSGQRVFQCLSAPEIIDRALEGHGTLTDVYRSQLGLAPCPAREYCTQYDETGLTLLSRLCEEEGIHYHYEFSAQGHVLVSGDSQTSFPRLQRPVAYVQGAGLVADQLMVKRFGVRFDTRASRAIRRDHDFEQPTLQMQAAHGSQPGAQQPDLKDHDYPDRFTHRECSKHLSRCALERHRADYLQVRDKNDGPALFSGHFLMLSAHLRGGRNDLWLLTEVLYEGRQPQILEESIDSGIAQGRDDFHQGYHNRFITTPRSAHSRPPLEHPKPCMLGCQTAAVIGPAGETIHCDQYGRVKVQFFWGRLSQADDNTSCWLHVTSNWAGKCYGGVAILWVGTEILVGSLEGDPDRPLVTGCLYHSEDRAPHKLPQNKIRSVFKTDSYSGSGGFNELHTEGHKDQEQIFVHAWCDWGENIKHDQKIRVGHEYHDMVKGDSYSEFKAEEWCTVYVDRKVELKVADHLSVADALHLRIGIDQFVEAGNEIHFKVGDKIAVKVGVELTLKGSSSFVGLDPGGVTLDGAQVMIDSGDSPGIGSGVRALSPL